MPRALVFREHSRGSHPPLTPRIPVLAPPGSLPEDSPYPTLRPPEARPAGGPPAAPVPVLRSSARHRDVPGAVGTRIRQGLLVVTAKPSRHPIRSASTMPEQTQSINAHPEGIVGRLPVHALHTKIHRLVRIGPVVGSDENLEMRHMFLDRFHQLHVLLWCIQRDDDDLRLAGAGRVEMVVPRRSAMVHLQVQLGEAITANVRVISGPIPIYELDLSQGSRSPPCGPLPEVH